MREFNLRRLNLKKLELGENELVLKKTTYEGPIIQDGYLLDKEGNKTGTKGDMYTKVIMDHILQKGTLDHNPRPHYEDYYEGATYDKENNVVITKEGQKLSIGEKESVHEKENGIEIWTPAHTLSVNTGVECTYDLSQGETPMITLRPIATKTSCIEMLWIYQKQSSDLVEFDEMLGISTWDDNKPISENEIHNWWKDWAARDKNGELVLNENGHPDIYTYGGTVRPRNMLKREVINVIKGNIEKGIKPNPDSRRLIVCLWQVDDFDKPHGLKPCAFLTIWNVRHEWDGKDYLDMTMVQRSSDFATAGCINQVQYAELQYMVAREVGMEPGYFTWKPINVQLYDRHIDQAIEMLDRSPVDGIDATIKLNENATNFDDMTADDIKILNKEAIQKVKKQNPQLKFQLGI